MFGGFLGLTPQIAITSQLPIKQAYRKSESGTGKVGCFYRKTLYLIISLSKISGVKRLREERFHLNNFCLPFQVGENHRHVAAELPDELPACAARRRQRLRVGHHRDRVEPALALADRFENRYALGADR